MPEITYDKASQAGYQERFDNWKTAVGLQAVDNLKPSEYLTKLAQDHIEGIKTIDEVENLLQDYYSVESNKKAAEKTRQDEADLVSARIAKLLDTKTFTLTENSLKAIHKKIFSGFKEYTPGKYRTHDIVKSEWVLDGDTVQYGHWETLEDEIELLLHQEMNFNYAALTLEQKVNHIVEFTSKVWVQHAFLEGNTRTTALFIIKYLRSVGFEVDNKPFEEKSWYFRNALVRANYRNAAIGISTNNKYLKQFYENLLMGKHNNLQNRTIHIYWEKDQSDTSNDPVNDPVTSVEQLVLEQIIQNPHATYQEIADATKKSRATIRRAIQSLKAKGILERIGSDKTGYWQI